MDVDGGNGNAMTKRNNREEGMVVARRRDDGEL